MMQPAQAGAGSAGTMWATFGTCLQIMFEQHIKSTIAEGQYRCVVVRSSLLHTICWPSAVWDALPVMQCVQATTQQTNPAPHIQEGMHRLTALQRITT
jgi:hypothetical protein